MDIVFIWNPDVKLSEKADQMSTDSLSVLALQNLHFLMVPDSCFPINFAPYLTKLLFLCFKKEHLPPRLLLLKVHDQDITFRQDNS